MPRLAFQIGEWLDHGGSADSVEAATMSTFSVSLDEKSLTEVNDQRAKTTRKYIRVPASEIAEWLLMNWWRLRWEPEPRNLTFSWRECHDLSTISREYVWPPIQFSSDGEFITVSMSRTPPDPVSPVRYLEEFSQRIEAKAFESAVAEFVSVVLERLAVRLPAHRRLEELWNELQQEQASAPSALRSRLEALAGVDPGDAPWIDSALALVKNVGVHSAEEVVATLAGVSEDYAVAEEEIECIKRSNEKVDLAGFALPISTAPVSQMPWQRGVRLAQELRAHLRLKPGPIPNEFFVRQLGNDLFASKSASKPKKLGGGFRDENLENVYSISLPSRRPHSIRFYLSRIIGHSIYARSARLIPVTETSTSAQQVQRSFAQEFLCPWDELRDFVEQQGTGEEGVADAAEKYNISQWVVQSTLVNRGAIPRSRLPG